MIPAAAALGERPGDRSMDLASRLLEGAIDLHVHPGPHLGSSPRRLDPFETAAQARAAGMRALVYMDVFEMSCGTSWLVNRWLAATADAPDRAPGGAPFATYGGIILNTVYGGLNPRAVRTALAYGDGAAFVSFGAHSTHFKASTEGRIVDGVPRLFSDLDPHFADRELRRTIRIPLSGAVPPDLDAILSLLAEHPHVYLLTGHVSGPEALRLVELAARYGIRRVLVSGLAVEELSLDEQRAAVGGGALLERSIAQYIGTEGIPKTHYYVERAYMDELVYDPAFRRTKHGGLRGLRAQIDAVGAEHLLISSDYGVRSLPPPVEGMRQAIACLLDLDVDVPSIRTMTRDNPARLLGLA
jgi:hypothetical protein